MQHATGISKDFVGIDAYLSIHGLVAVATFALPYIRRLPCSRCAG
jgi:hypothetical protein